MDTRKIIDVSLPRNEKVKLGFELAFEKAINENKSISIIGYDLFVLRNVLDEIFGLDFVAGIKDNEKVFYKDVFVHTNIIIQRDIKKVEVNSIALYVFPSGKLLSAIAECKAITDEIIIPWCEDDIISYKKKWHL